MTAITTRVGKGSPLTNAEVDANFTGLNADKEDKANKGVANGYAGLDATGKVPAAQLPSYVDDVMEFANLAGFPATGEAGKIYVALDINKTYRWSGSAYIYITSGAVDSVAGKTGVITLTKADVGLAAVENKSSATIRGEITSLNVTTALGFTPYNATNPSDFITSASLIWSNLSAKPTTLAGYGITDASAASHTHNYLPLSGETLTGKVTGVTAGMSMVAGDQEAQGSFVCRASGTGDSNLAGMSFHNDAYAIKMGVRADGCFGIGGWSRGAWSWYSAPNGDMVAAGNVAAYSDERRKTNWRGVDSQLIEQLAQVKHGIYDRIDENLTQIGVSAQSLQKVIPDAVITNPDGYLSVSYGNAALVAAIQLSKRVVELEARLNALEGSLKGA